MPPGQSKELNLKLQCSEVERLNAEAQWMTRADRELVQRYKCRLEVESFFIDMQ